MARYAYICRDPRGSEGDARLLVGFDIASFGSEPSGYGEHFDPGSGPDIDIISVADADSEAGDDVLSDLADDHLEALFAQITEGFDFHDAERSERYDPREDV